MDSQLHRRDYDRPLYPDHKDEAQTVNDTPVVRSGLAEPTVMGTPVLAEDLYTTQSDLPVRSSGQRERDGAPPPGYGYETHVTDVSHDGHYTYQYKGSVGKHNFLDEVEVVRSPPLSAGYESLTDPVRAGDYGYGQDVNREVLEGCFGNPSGLDDERYGGLPPPSTGVYGTRLTDIAQVGDHEIGKSAGMEEDPSVPKPTTKPTTTTGGKEVGITEVLHSFDKMKVFDKHDNQSESLESDKHKEKVYAGSHDQFKPEPVENPPLDTIAANSSHPNSSYSQKISSATSAIADKAAAVKNTIVSKLNSSSEQKSDANTKTLLPTATALSHKVADTLSSTLGPVYEKVAEVGSSVTSKMHGSGDGATVGNRETKTEGKGVKEYLADTFKPHDDDKALSDVITQAFHRGKGNQQAREGSTTTAYEVEVPREGCTTTYEVEVGRDEEVEVGRDKGERRLQESGN